MIYYTSDNHFNHHNIIGYCFRPFDNVRHMNEAMIRNWNKIVKDDDIVYHLGDFAMGNPASIPFILQELKGNIVLIAGNHDRKRNDKYFPEVIRRPFVIEDEGRRIELVHNPKDSREIKGDVFCGHVHERWRTKETTKRVFYNVGVDVRFFKPVTAKQIFEAYNGNNILDS